MSDKDKKINKSKPIAFRLDQDSYNKYEELINDIGSEMTPSEFWRFLIQSKSKDIDSVKNKLKTKKETDEINIYLIRIYLFLIKFLII